MAQKPRERQVDCAIIGAGPVGILAAATRAPGQNTLVLEREDWVGGNWRSFQKDGALFESGLHFVHQPRQWNEYLFDLGFELPVTEPTGQALLWEKGSFRPLPSDALSPLEQLYVHPENVIVRGGMQSFLEKVVMAKDITVSHGEALISLETDDSGIALGKTTAGTLTADQWIWTGSPRVARRYLPPAAAKHTDFGDYQAAIVSQFILRRPVSDLSSVLVLRHRVDHIEYRFLGLFDSNVDPTRAPAGRQTSTWMCFLQPEEFEDANLVNRLRRALRRDVESAFADFGSQVLWERLAALPEAAGPVATQERTAAEPRWKNVRFLTQASLLPHAVGSWTNRQIGHVAPAPHAQDTTPLTRS